MVSSETLLFDLWCTFSTKHILWQL